LKKLSRVFIFSAFFPPERGAAANRIYNMARGLQENGFTVEVITALPNYPTGKIFPAYTGRLRMREIQDGVPVRRYWIFPTISKSALARLISMCSYCVSLLLAAPALRREKPDICIVQGHPLFISWTAIFLSKFWFRASTVLNVSDIWPLSALEMGALKPGRMYRLLERIEMTNYNRSDLVVGQSEEILEHVLSRRPGVPTFLYRNLPRTIDSPRESPQWHQGRPKVIYAGLLGYAQGLLEIVRSVDWDALGIELTIYGDGGDRAQIEGHLAQHPTPFVRLMGMIPPQELNQIIHNFHAALVPLATRIQGAVPSKLFELSHQRVPIIFSGGGEGARIVTQHGLGFVSEPGDLAGLVSNLTKLKEMASVEYLQLVANCEVAASRAFDFETQIKEISATLAGSAPAVLQEAQRV
jgi:glycosyltransferase involved in cell wall biosynthesis